MSSEVLYRKWRPQTLAEVVGQEVVTTTLRNAVRAGRVGHAYLFSGPRGTGKTSTGRILAKAVNCLSPVDGEPCNICEACTSISGGRSLDVIEIDAASNRGIDDIRQLRERVGYAPGSLRRKVYVIDEVHMLTDAASNALLKTLEEPPPHVMFVLATTEFHKVMPTIASRCQCFNFRRLSLDAIVAKLRLVCEREGIEAGEEALEIMARAGDGSLRDAENVVQRLLASHGRQLSSEQVKVGLGVADDAYALRLAGRMIARDLAGGLRVLHEANYSGVDMRQFGRQTVATLRNLLLVKSECEDIVEVGRERGEELRRIADGATIHSLALATRLFSEATTRNASQQLLALELAFVDSVAQPSQSPSAVSGSPEKGSRGRKAVEGPPAPTAGQRTGKAVSEPAGPVGARAVKSGGKSASASVSSQLPASPSPEPGSSESNLPGMEAAVEVAAPASVRDEPPVEGELGQIRARWRDYVDSLRGLGSTGNLDAFLRSACEPVSVENDVLELRFSHKFHMEKVEDGKYRHLIEERLEAFFGHPYKVKCVLQPQDEDRSSPDIKQSGGLVEAAIRMGARAKR